MGKTIRHRLAGIGVAAAVLATVGCGAESNFGDKVMAGDAAVANRQETAAFLSRSAANTQEAGTARFTSVTEMDMGSMGGMTMRMEGQVDPAASRAHISMTGEGTVMGTDGADAMTMEMVVDGTTAYLRSELLSELSGADTPWLRLDSAELGTATGGGGLGSDPSDPTALLDMLDEVGENTQEVGTEEIDGVQTRHIKADLSFEAMMEKAREQGAGDQLDEMVAQSGVDFADLGSIPIEVWVGEDGLVRRMRMTMDLADMIAAASDEDVPSGMSMTITQTMDLTGFGEPVDIVVPPADQVSDAVLPGLGD